MASAGETVVRRAVLEAVSFVREELSIPSALADEAAASAVCEATASALTGRRMTGEGTMGAEEMVACAAKTATPSALSSAVPLPTADSRSPVHVVRFANARENKAAGSRRQSRKGRPLTDCGALVRFSTTHSCHFGRKPRRRFSGRW